MTQFFTYADAVEHGLDYLGGTADAQASRDCRRSVLAAYREVTNARSWSYLTTHGRINTNAPYSTGTIAFDLTGGTYEREVLLYGGTWPTWAGAGSKLRVGIVTYDVAERRSSTSLTLTPVVSPALDFDLVRFVVGGLSLADPIVVTSSSHGLSTGDTVIVEGVGSTNPSPVVSANGTWVITRLTADTFSLDSSTGASDTAWDSATGTWRLPPTTVFTLYHDDYPLPSDFVKTDTLIFEGNFGGLFFRSAADQLWWQRARFSSGTPRYFCIKGGGGGGGSYPGRLLVGFFPYPDRSVTIDYVYERRPRDLRYETYSIGTVSGTGGSTTVTGNGTAFVSDMVGSVLRIGTARDLPTSWIGSAPPAFEAVVVEVLSGLSLRLSGAPMASFSELKYLISDPIDIEQGALLTAFLRCLEKQLTIARTVKESKADAFAAYEIALKEAQAADSRSIQGQALGANRVRSVQYKNMPATFF